jgi:hypothetical protein
LTTGGNIFRFDLIKGCRINGVKEDRKCILKECKEHNMNKKLISLSILGIALALVFAFGNYQPAQAAGGYFGWYTDRPATNLNRDLGAFHRNDVNQFGDDRAYSSMNGTDRDADFRAHNFVPNTYGLQGDYWYDQGGS